MELTSNKTKKKNKPKISLSLNKREIRNNIITSQDTVPILTVNNKYGLIKNANNLFVKTYLIGENNYTSSPEQEKVSIINTWKTVLNSIPSEMEFQLTINNKTINQEDFSERVLIKETGDKYDYLRKEYNNVILDRLANGNYITKDKYLTIGCNARTSKEASTKLNQIGESINNDLESVQSYALPLSLEEELENLYHIYNNTPNSIIQKEKVVSDTGHVEYKKTFDYENMRNLGLSINDIISPSSMRIEENYIKLGRRFVRVLKVNELPNQLSDNFIKNITDVNFNCITTINYQLIPPKEAAVLVSTNMGLIREEKRNAIQSNQKQGIYDESSIPVRILDREAEAKDLRDRITKEDERLFRTSITVIVYANTMEELEANTNVMLTEYKKLGVDINIYKSQQEEGFNSTIPLAYNQIIKKRTLTSSSAAILLPFSTLEVNDENGINYSCNKESKNLIVFDRMKCSNFNGFVLGTPGSGKSFTSKIEMLNVFLKSDSDIIVIDPENEYGSLANILGGTIINIAPGNNVHINPLDITTDYELSGNREDNPISAKADFIIKLMESIVNPMILGPIEKSIIDECVKLLYMPFVDKKTGILHHIPSNKMPTLTDLQKILSQNSKPEAQALALSLAKYSKSGLSNTFGFQTNIEVNNRFVVYQIRDIGDDLKPIAMLTILDHIWDKTVQNRSLGKNTWFYVDEIYLLFQQEYSATFLNQLFRRARKYGGVPTGITQNVTPLLESPTARDMLQNCECIQILKQNGPDRDRLRDLLNLSDEQLSVITNSQKGQGLFYMGNKGGAIPFYSRFPKDNDIYRVLTSDMREIKEFEEAEKRAKSRELKLNNNI